MKVWNKCDKCGKKTEELALVNDSPITHYCYECCEEEALDIVWHGNSGYNFYL